MPQARLNLCDLCGLALDGYVGMRHQTVNHKNGLKVEVGYSIGGWGQRQNHIDFSGEVCDGCYKSVLPAVLTLKTAIDACRAADYEPMHQLEQ